jgi:outer membrane lipoprotein SlyB
MINSFASAALLALTAIGGVAALTYEGGQSRLTASATGIVTDSSLIGATYKAASPRTQVGYRVTINGETLSLGETLPGDQRGKFAPGQRVPLCYDPSRPKTAKISDDPFSCG